MPDKSQSYISSLTLKGQKTWNFEFQQKQKQQIKHLYKLHFQIFTVEGTLKQSYNP